MARIEIDRQPFVQARGELSALAAEQRRLDAGIARLQQALAAAQRNGGRDAGQFEGPLARARAERQALQRRRDGLLREFDARADAALGALPNRDPSLLVQSLDGAHPIAMLPLRIETRYLQRDGQTVLGIRVYPDDLHTIDHEPTPTANELAAAQAIWRARFAHDEAEAARLQRDLTAAYGRGRALWLLRVLTPTNAPPAAGEAVEPQFPATDTIAAAAKATRAVLLPERFCAIGYAAGRREVFRVWGNTVPDELLLTPDWQATDRAEKLLAGERAWMLDFDAALANGMALLVTQRQISGRFDLARGTLERLLVVGFEWTRSPAEAAADFARPAGSTARFHRPGLRAAGHADQQHRGRARRRHGDAGRAAGRQRRAAAADLGFRPATRVAAAGQHRPGAPQRAAHRAAHDEPAVARHLRRVPAADVEPARRQLRTAAQHAHAVRAAALCRRLRAPDRRVAGTSRAQAALRHCCRWWASATSPAATCRPRRR